MDYIDNYEIKTLVGLFRNFDFHDFFFRFRLFGLIFNKFEFWLIGYGREFWILGRRKFKRNVRGLGV